MSRPPFTAACLALFTVSLLWISGAESSSWGDSNSQIAHNLVRKGMFHDAGPANPDDLSVPYARRTPGYPVYLAAVFSMFPESHLQEWDVTCEGQCVPPPALRTAAMRVTAILSAVTVGGVFALTWFFTRRWISALVAGAAMMLWCVVWQEAVNMQSVLAGTLLLGHTAGLLAFWKRPRLLPAVWCGVALGLLVLTRAVFQYWIPGLALVLAVAVWLDTERRPVLYRACAVCVLTAAITVLPWMVRNAVVVGDFSVSGRGGENLAMRADYGRLMNWSEVRGSFVYWLQGVRRIPGGKALWRSFQPEPVGYAQLDQDNPDGIYYRSLRAQGPAAQIAGWADASGAPWLSPSFDADLRRTAFAMMKEDWLKQIALTPAFAVRGTGAMRAGPFGLLVVPAFVLMLALAWKRRDVALALLMLPSLYGFGIHAVATHFVPRYAHPLVPIAFIVCVLAAEAMLVGFRRPSTPSRPT